MSGPQRSQKIAIAIIVFLTKRINLNNKKIFFKPFIKTAIFLQCILLSAPPHFLWKKSAIGEEKRKYGEDNKLRDKQLFYLTDFHNVCQPIY